MSHERTLDDSETDVRLFTLADQFLDELRHKPQLPLEDFARRYPDLERQILEILPGVVMAERWRTHAQSVDQTMPASLGGFQLVRRIGSGGMGTVYEATHPRLSRRTAIKVLNPEVAGNLTVQQRLQAEADLASRIHHPHVVPVLDFAEDEGVAFIAMRYIDGISVDRILHAHWGLTAPPSAPSPQWPTPGHDFQQIARMGAQAASALAHAHEQGTIHRDVKPGNLIVDRQGKTWVTDFGLATNCGLPAPAGADIVGTPRYVSPEQLDGEADERSDIYSLGVTLFELATGQQAFARQTDLSVRRTARLPQVTSCNPRVPAPLAAIIDAACAFDREQRYPTARELQTVLSRFAHSGVSGDRRRSVRNGRRRLRPRRLLALAFVLCAAAVLSALTGRQAWIDTGQQMQWFLNADPVVLSRPEADADGRQPMSNTARDTALDTARDTALDPSATPDRSAGPPAASSDGRAAAEVL